MVHNEAMEEIGIRELNQQTSKVLRRVTTSGESVTITDHGRRVAKIVPIAPTRYEQLLETGQATEGARDVRPVRRARLPRPAQAVLDELREDRL